MMHLLQQVFRHLVVLRRCSQYRAVVTLAALLCCVRCGLCWEFTASSVPPGVPRRLAVCYFGRIGNLRSSSKLFESDPSTLRLAYPSQRRHVVEANERRGWRVDTFVHSPDVQLSHEVKALLRPTASLFEEDPAELQARHGKTPDQQKSEVKLRAFGHSVHAVVNLMLATASKMGITYDAVFLMRLDLMFFRDVLVPGLSDLANGALWVPSWCEPRDSNSRVYGTSLKGVKCGRLHAHGLHKFGAPDYLFIGSSDSITRLASWGPDLDSNIQRVAEIYDQYVADFVINGGAHTVIPYHCSLNMLSVNHMPHLVEQIDLIVARRAGCPLEVDWVAPRRNIGKACQIVQLNGRCPKGADTVNPKAQNVCPLEGMRVCAGAHTAGHGRNCSLDIGRNALA